LGSVNVLWVCDTEGSLAAPSSGQYHDEITRGLTIDGSTAGKGTRRSREPYEAEPDAEALWTEQTRRRLDEIVTGTAELEEWESVRERLRSAALP
jgi:hypothetical protein